MTTPPPSQRTRIRRKPQRGRYDFATIAAIIDEALVCHVAFRHGDSVHCIPTACWRVDGHLYLHAAANARLIDALLSSECAVSLAIVDALILARSAFHHSMNYRSVVIYGRFAAVEDRREKEIALAAFVDRISPGRSRLVRPPAGGELSGTQVLRLPLAEAAAKIRDWGVEDDAEDLDLPVWAGVVPLRLAADEPVPDGDCGYLQPPVLPDLVVVRACRNSPANAGESPPDDDAVVSVPPGAG